MKDREARDIGMDRAREDAEGTELLDVADRRGLLERERESAQGMEVFSDPDVTLSATNLAEGSPGHETLTSNNVGLGRDDDSDRRDNGK